MDEPIYYVTTATTGVIFAQTADAVPVLGTILQPAQVDPEVRDQGRAWLIEQRGWRPATDQETADRQYVLVCVEHRETYELAAERLFATDVETAAEAAARWLASYPTDEWRHARPTFQGTVLARS